MGMVHPGCRSIKAPSKRFHWSFVAGVGVVFIKVGITRFIYSWVFHSFKKDPNHLRSNKIRFYLVLLQIS